MSSNSVGSRLMMTRACAVALRHQRETCRRPDDERRTDRDEKIGRASHLLGALHLPLGHRLTEGDRRGLDMAVAGRARRRAPARIEEPLDPRQLIARRAIEAGRVGCIAMQLYDVFRSNARGLVQVVDVLSHHAGRLAGAVERSKRLMPAPRLGAAELILHGETPPPGLVARLLAGEEIREVDRPHLGPDAAGERKSGMPHSVEMPAPVKGTMTPASSTSARRRSMAVVTSGAIMLCPGGRSAVRGRGISAHAVPRWQFPPHVDTLT